MTPDVVVYLSSLQKQTPSRKVDVLNAFADGARACGARVTIQKSYDVLPCKLAVILGWPSPSQSGPNIKLRAAVVKHQHRTNNHVMAIDASTFKFHDNEGKYLRYSLNGVFYDTSEYANKFSNADRWNVISRDLGLQMQPWYLDGDHILFLMQRDGGWSIKGLDPVQWALNKYHEVRRHTDRHIIIRPHPGKKIDLSIFTQLPGVSISDSKNTSITEDLRHAKAALVFNSSSGVASILEGRALVVDDQSSVCWNVAHHDLTGITEPKVFDREQWIWDLAAAHWSDDESRRGLIFNKFIPYLQ